MRFPDDCPAVNAAFGVDAPPSPAHRPVSAAESLLFGLLALQNNFIDRNGLVAAFDAWVTDKTKPLGQILLDRGALSPARYAAPRTARPGTHPAARLRSGAQPGRAAGRPRGAGPARAGRRPRPPVQPDGGQPRGRRRRPRPTGRRPSTGSGQAEGADPEGRFQIVRFHDRGNLGEVYLARDSQLHRIVALKRIKQRPAADQDKRARFVVEAEITGRLEHPGIVPVYSLGTFDDGRPFYAMRFIRGDNLKAAIDQFHQDEQAGRDAGARARWRSRSCCGGSWTCATRSPTRTAGAWCTAT